MATKHDVEQLMQEKNSKGLANLGMTCYVNTAIQCLGYCKAFLDLVLNKTNVLAKSTPLTDELHDVYRELWVNGNAIAPYKFLHALQTALGNSLRIVEQNDICEFLMLYLDKLNIDMSVEVIVDEETVNDMKIKASKFGNEQFANLVYSMDVAWLNHCKKEYSPIVDLFHGQQVSQIICGKCRHIHHNYEVFSALSVPIPSMEGDIVPTLYDACDVLFKNEFLNTTEREWKCDKCDTCVKSSKCTRLWKLPKILIVSIKRFDYTLKKNTNVMQVPSTINMKKYRLQKDTYQEYKITSICFHGGSATSGHYVAICRHATGKWLFIDDQHVRTASDHEVQYARNNGYVYFFEACV